MTLLTTNMGYSGTVGIALPSRNMLLFVAHGKSGVWHQHLLHASRVLAVAVGSVRLVSRALRAQEIAAPVIATLLTVAALASIPACALATLLSKLCRLVRWRRATRAIR